MEECGFKNIDAFLDWLFSLVRRIEEYDTGEIVYHNEIYLSYDDIGSYSNSVFSYVWPIRTDVIEINMHNILGISKIYVEKLILYWDKKDVKMNPDAEKCYVLFEGSSDMLYFFENLFYNASGHLMLNFVVTDGGGLDLPSKMSYLFTNRLQIKDFLLQEMIANMENEDIELRVGEVSPAINTDFYILFIIFYTHNIKVKKIRIYLDDWIFGVKGLRRMLDSKFSDKVDEDTKTHMFKDYYEEIVFLTTDITFWQEAQKNSIQRWLKYNMSSIDLIV